MEAYREQEWCRATLPVTEEACRTVLSLPIYPGLRTAEVEEVIRALRAVP